MTTPVIDFAGLGPIFDAMPDAMVIVDNEGRIIFVNKQTESMFGYRRDEMFSHPVEMLIPSRFHHAHQHHRSVYFSAPRVRPMGMGQALFGRHKDGHEFSVEISLSSLNWDGQQMAFAAVRDVTDRKALEDQLHLKNEALEMQNKEIQAAMKMKSDFLANMSHELRTPLNGIIGFAELMHSGMVGKITDEHKEYLNDILKSAQHLLHLINDVLDLAKIESGKIEFHPLVINVETLVKEVCNVMRAMIIKKKIEIKLVVDPTIKEIVNDPSRLKQILYNYLSNAVKFSYENNIVEITVAPEGKGYFKLSVKDNGIGISESDQQLIFTEFQQLDAGASKKFQGTGLGLALTRRIVEAQNGSVGVSSKPGEGCTFFAILPINYTKGANIDGKNNINHR